MDMRPAISAPLPWLTMAAGWLLSGGARERARRLLRMPRSLKVTKAGKWYIGLLFIIGIAAINTGNNLLYLIVAALLSLIVISGFLSESTLRGLVAECTPPRYVFRGSPAPFSVRVVNSKRRLPSFSFVACGDGGQAGRSAYFLKLGAGEAAEAAFELTFRERGFQAPGELRLKTRFPFGLFVKGKAEAITGEVLVLPAIDRATGLPLLNGGGLAQGRSPGKGEGSEIHGLREYTLTDDARRIDWFASARGQDLLVKEYEREAGRSVLIVFDNSGGSAKERFEALVDEAASIAARYAEAGWQVGLKTNSMEISPAAGQNQLFWILRELALISPSGSAEPSLKAVCL